MADPQIPLLPGKIYHIYNHTVGKDTFFRCEKDYSYFLNRFREYILPVGDVFGYCLMSNHFHIVIRIKSAEEIDQFFRDKLGVKKFDRLKIDKKYSVVVYVTRQFSNFFNSYAKYYNSCYKRWGTLFKRTFRRKNIDTKDYLKRVIRYTHNNPVTAGLVKKPEDWKYSSYPAIVSDKETLISRAEVIGFFGTLETLVEYHRIRLRPDGSFQNFEES